MVNDSTVTEGNVPSSRPNIDDLFRTIEDALDTGADKVDIFYNDETGIPNSIDIDPSSENSRDEITYGVRNFRSLEG